MAVSLTPTKRGHVVNYEDGHFRIVGYPTPTLGDLVRHAQKFGPESVHETAQMYLGPEALARLRIELDEIEAQRKSSAGYSIGKKRRRSREETRAAVVALSVEGLVPSAIADKLDLSDKTVLNHLKAR